VDYLPGRIQSPSVTPHLDYSASTAQFTLGKRFPEAAALITPSTPRWQILGLWRPLKIVQRDPFTLIDARTVPESDYVDLKRDKTMGFPGIAVSLMKCEDKGSHKWYYWSGQTPEEMLLFKHFDSKRDVEAWRCGHTSVSIPGTDDLPVRENFECRAVVIY
jgi:hypothetical protein